MKKTYQIEELIKKINRYLKADISQLEKKSLCYLLEEVLLETKRYGGYQYLFEYDMETEKTRKYDRYYHAKK